MLPLLPLEKPGRLLQVPSATTKVSKDVSDYFCIFQFVL